MISENNKRPVFSIITPTFKRPDMLRRSIRSVAGQTFGNYEHIIIDDGNDPVTKRIIQDFSDGRIVLLNHDRQKGAAACRNSGIRKSRGGYITFLDDDDEYMPEYLEKMYEQISNASNNIGFIWTGIERIENPVNNKFQRKNVVWPAVFTNLEEARIAATSIGNGCGVCLRRECIDRIGFFDENLKVCSDTDFLIRLVQNYNCQTINEVLVRIHKHADDQLTGKCFNKQRISAWRIILDRYGEFFKKHPMLASVHYSSLATLCYISGDKKKGREAIIKAIRVNPSRTRLYFELIALELVGKNLTQTGFGKFKRYLIQR